MSDKMIECVLNNQMYGSISDRAVWVYCEAMVNNNPSGWFLFNFEVIGALY